MKKLYALNLSGLCLLFIVFVMASCSDGAPGDDFADDNYTATGTQIVPSSPDGCFLTDPTVSTVTFDVTSAGETASEADVVVSYNGGAEFIFETVTIGESTTVSVPMTEVLSLTGVNAADVAAGDLVTIAFDGKSSSGTYRSGSALNFNVGCASELAGTHSYVSTNFQAITGTCPTEPVTGEVVFEDLGCGVYRVSDLGFGQYGTTCWNDSPATSPNAIITDVCDLLTTGGMDQYQLTYIWTITGVNGAELSMSWANDYGDSGDVVLTKESGEWPSSLKTN